ncbi:choice-of-anchor J domain-containing protein [bacterium]|nr:choice-of-anchor J domain-containing protein [candidate division CSSED10-310 bacterium]
MNKYIQAMLMILSLTPCGFGQIYCHVGAESCAAITTGVVPAVLNRSYTESQYVLSDSEMEACFPGTGSTDILEIGWYQCSGSIGANQRINVYFYESAAPCDVHVCSSIGYPNGSQVVTGQQIPIGSSPGWRMVTLDSPYTYTHGNCLVVSICETELGSDEPVQWVANFEPGNGYSRSKDHISVYDCDLITLDSIGIIECADAWPSTRFLIDAADTRNLTMSNSSGTGFGTVSPFPGLHAYPLNGTATLTADAQYGSDFVYWIVDSTIYSSSKNETLLMDADHTVQAIFNIAEPRALPVCENFDNPWTGTPAAPSGWLVIDSDADGYTFRKGNSYIDPTVSQPFACIGMGCNNDWLISPQIAIPEAISPEVVWWDRVERESRPNIYQVLVSTTGYAISDFSVLATFTCTNVSWMEHSLSLESYAGESVYIAFHEIFSSSRVYGFGIDDLCIREEPVYVNLTMEPVIGNGRIQPIAGIHQYVQNSVVSLKADPVCGWLFHRWMGPVSNPHSATTSIMMDSDHTVQAEFIQGITTFYEDFESGATGWTYYDADGDMLTWNIMCSNTTPHSGQCNATSASWQYGALTPDNWLVSPPIDISGTSEALLSWYIAVQDQAWPDEYYEVLISTTGNAIADFTSVIHSENVAESGPDGNNYWYRRIDLQPYLGETVYVAFRHCSSTNLFRINLDDVCVTTSDGSAPTATPSQIPPVPSTSSVSLSILLVVFGIAVSLSIRERK